jgi:hypothetical protein
MKVIFDVKNEEFYAYWDKKMLPKKSLKEKIVIKQKFSLIPEAPVFFFFTFFGSILP